MDQKNIRNFAIIAHIDHGKSTLADRLLEITGTVQKDKMEEQFLDQNPISRKRGITIKLAPVRMNYKLDNVQYILNLIDTPGHVDFSYEVSRTLAACEGVVLLVDVTQNIQTQTVAHYHTAKKLGLPMIPVINKIDLPNADVEGVSKTIGETFGFSKEDILLISAKSGEGVEDLLKKIVSQIPSPKGNFDSPLTSLIFDAVYDSHKGVVALTRIFDGQIAKGDKIICLGSRAQTTVIEVGTFSPFPTAQKELTAGDIGYIVTGIKNIRDCSVGDTITKVQSASMSPLPGYEKPKPSVFFGVYPKRPEELGNLKEGLEKLALADAALTIAPEHSSFLGNGFRVGFLGLLHADIVRERLKQEHGIEPLLTTPQVLYEREGDAILEPFMSLIVYVPATYVGAVMTVCQARHGKMINLTYQEHIAVLEYEMPYSMFIQGLAGELKSVSAGFASIDYSLLDYRVANLVQLEIKVNDEPIDVLSELVYKDDSIHKAIEKTGKLKETLTRQQYRQVIQGVIDGRIVAREEIPPFRKDVLAKMSGGDRTRKDKLLEAQKKGKSKMVHQAKIDIPQEALFSLIDSD